MVEWNAEKQVFASQYFDRRGFVHRRVARRRGNPTQSGLRISRFHDLMHQLHTFGSALGRGRQNLNGLAAIVSQSQPQQSGIAVPAR